MSPSSRVGREFQRLGYVELFSFCARRFGLNLPPTCRNSTRHDSVLLPRVFRPLLQSASVDVDCHLFDSHAPVLLTFELPQHNPCKQVWRGPTSWMEFEPNADLAQQSYLQGRASVQQCLETCDSRDGLDTAFAQRASVLEASVDSAIQEAHHGDPLRCPFARLPRRAKGRCVYREVKAQALPVTAPSARCGDYSPPDEALSHRSRHKVKQVRRIQAFRKRLSLHTVVGSCRTAANKCSGCLTLQGMGSHTGARVIHLALVSGCCGFRTLLNVTLGSLLPLNRASLPLLRGCLRPCPQRNGSVMSWILFGLKARQ